MPTRSSGRRRPSDPFLQTLNEAKESFLNDLESPENMVPLRRNHPIALAEHAFKIGVAAGVAASVDTPKERMLDFLAASRKHFANVNAKARENMRKQDNG